MIKGITLERIVWLSALLVIIYGSITATNWYNDYHKYKAVAESVDAGAIAKAEAYSTLKGEFESLQGELETKNAAIEQLKAQTLR